MKSANRVALGCSVMWLSLPALAHPPGVADEDQAIAHEVEWLREELKRAIQHKDVIALRALYADNFTHTHGSGRVDGKNTRIVSLLSGDPVIETAPVEELNYRVFGNGTIIVTGKSPILSKVENKTKNFRWMVVYVKSAGLWQVAASQATRLP